MKIIFILVFLLSLCCSVDSQPTPANAIVIDEIMADPSPSVGLPAIEFVELENRSPVPVNLNGFRLGDGTAYGNIAQNILLQPDSFVICCSNSAAAEMKKFGTVCPVNSFPSLSNAGGILVLRSKEGRLIHAVQYGDQWYRNAVKRDGGYTLEMIDTDNPCGQQDNWMASTDVSGGTPGRANSVRGQQKDNVAPNAYQAIGIDSTTIEIFFDEPLDSGLATNVNFYRYADDAAAIKSIAAEAPFFDRVLLSVRNKLVADKIVNISISEVPDCVGNHNSHTSIVIAALPSPADSADLVINEILFNPVPAGADYVELFNRSTHAININTLYLSTRATGGSLSFIKKLQDQGRLLFPGQFVVLSEDTQAVRNTYVVKQEGPMCAVSSMPSLPDDAGDLLLLNKTGKIIDEIKYDAHWHFALLSNDEGVSLERINAAKPADNAANWHSAATANGFGTPGYVNSQSYTGVDSKAAISLSSPIISPDNDGFQDQLTLTYHFGIPGFVCSINIYDISGRIVRSVVNDALCGREGYFRWDGLNEQRQPLPVGRYIIVTEAFSTNGEIRRFKNVVAIARRWKQDP